MNNNSSVHTSAPSTTGQFIAGHHVSIMRASGARVAKVADQDGLYAVPVELLPLSAGKDVWMRRILVRCSVCREIHPAGEMEGGGKDVCCQPCIEKIGAEMEG